MRQTIKISQVFLGGNIFIQQLIFQGEQSLKACFCTLTLLHQLRMIFQTFWRGTKITDSIKKKQAYQGLPGTRTESIFQKKFQFENVRHEILRRTQLMVTLHVEILVHIINRNNFPVRPKATKTATDFRPQLADFGSSLFELLHVILQLTQHAQKLHLFRVCDGQNSRWIAHRQKLLLNSNNEVYPHAPDTKQ